MKIEKRDRMDPEIYNINYQLLRMHPLTLTILSKPYAYMMGTVLLATGAELATDLFHFERVPVLLFLFVSVLIVIDFVFALIAAFVNSTSKNKAIAWTVFKIVGYALFMIALAVAPNLPAAEVSPWIEKALYWVRLLFFAFTLLWEYDSIGISIDRIFGAKPEMFKLLDGLAALLKRIIFSRLERYVNKDK